MNASHQLFHAGYIDVQASGPPVLIGLLSAWHIRAYMSELNLLLGGPEL